MRGVRGGLDWERERAREWERLVAVALLVWEWEWEWELAEGRGSSMMMRLPVDLMGPGLWMDLRRWWLWVCSGRDGERLWTREERGLMLSGERGGEVGRSGDWRVLRDVVNGEVLCRTWWLVGKGKGGTGGMSDDIT